MAYEDRYTEFEQYLTSGEPGVEERARNWSIAIGLQDVDGLKPSEFLLEQFRTYNITKNQWILDGESIEYGSAGSLMKLLTFDFSEEKKFDYSMVSSVEAIKHIVRFISDIWQIHAFVEGNTRTTAVFLIKYIKVSVSM